VSAADEVAAFKRKRQRLAVLVRRAQRILKHACHDAGIRGVVTGRTKTVASFAKKAVQGKPVYDSAGVRLVLVYPDDRDRAVELVRNAFAPEEWSNDFNAAMRPEVFSYRGYHQMAKLKAADAAKAHASVRAEAFEVQVHRPGEALWASMNHDLLYKGLVAVSPDAQRAMHRMAALLELVDMGVAEVKREIQGHRDFAEASVLSALEALYVHFSLEPFDSELSIAVLRAMLPISGPKASLRERLETFVKTKRTKLVYVLGRYEDPLDHVLLRQPESLLLFMLLDEQRGNEVANAWPEALPESVLEAVQALWQPG
jgi:ppGpp synthetase/RelA/SpoT-type nucleotidyltranferase